MGTAEFVPQLGEEDHAHALENFIGTATGGVFRADNRGPGGSSPPAFTLRGSKLVIPQGPESRFTENSRFGALGAPKNVPKSVPRSVPKVFPKVFRKCSVGRDGGGPDAI